MSSRVWKVSIEVSSILSRVVASIEFSTLPTIVLERIRQVSSPYLAGFGTGWRRSVRKRDAILVACVALSQRSQLFAKY